MASAPRRVTILLLVATLAMGLATAPALAHEAHDSHGGSDDSSRSIWPYLFGIGSVAAVASLFAGHRFDVPREFAIGFAAGGVALAAGAAIVWAL